MFGEDACETQCVNVLFVWHGDIITRTTGERQAQYDHRRVRSTRLYYRHHHRARRDQTQRTCQQILNLERERDAGWHGPFASAPLGAWAERTSGDPVSLRARATRVERSELAAWPPPYQASLEPPRSIKSRRRVTLPPVGLDSSQRPHTQTVLPRCAQLE